MSVSNSRCLVCKMILNVSSYVNIFRTSLPRNGELLANFISKVLCTTFPELNDSYICSQCYNLFQMLEQAQNTVLNIRCEILKIYCAAKKRKSMKQVINNDRNPTTSTVSKTNKLTLNNANEYSKEEPNLQCFQIKESDKQQCVQDKITNQATNVSNLNYAIETAEKSKVPKQNLADSDEEVSTSNYDNNSHNNLKKEQVLRNDTICNSIALITDNRVYDVSSSKVNARTLDSNTEGRNCFSLIDSEGEVKTSIKTNSLFSDNKLEVQNITASVELKWKELDESATELKENTECKTVLIVDRIKVPVKSEKTSKFNLKSLNYSCSICGKKWRTPAELKIHIKTHSSLKPYMCEKCGQAYKHKHALEIHVGMHNGINPFQCNFCSKSFSQKIALMRHLPMHTGETRYQCELCGKRFIHHTSYNMHKLSHSGKKSYKCHICDLSLLSTSHLKRHVRAHTGEKPYTCTLCGKRFAERYNLIAHQKVHYPFENKIKKTNETRYQCNHCNLVFEQKHSLHDHLKQHTDINDKSDLENSYSVSLLQPESNELSKNVNSKNNMLHQPRIQISQSESKHTDNQKKFLFLQNPVSKVDESSFTVTFNNQEVPMESTNYNASLQVIIEPTDNINFK
nr:zinc finger protein 567-like isoform X1 [Nomia melanderi]XP_031842980.1 zinc finger protein 567-like isoform X1 [Nomia melanderi]XP_031842981.1 zinc finger protein 567-like isoform X1 [Nomia melanderi]XP_031842982.1 zinc finger protein 567-like isoform X1 [Nomia melanderi]